MSIRIVAELAPVVRRDKTDFTSRVAYAHALLLCGDRDAALDQISSAYSLREILDYAAMDRLAMLLYFTAQRTKALEVVKSFAFAEGVKSPPTAANHAQIAAWAVDIDLLRDLAHHHQELEINSGAVFLLEILTKNFAADQVAKYQESLLDIVKGCQVATCFSVLREDDGGWMLLNSIFFDHRKDTRRSLEAKLDAALDIQVDLATADSVRTVFTAAPSKADGVVSIGPSLHLA